MKRLPSALLGRSTRWTAAVLLATFVFALSAGPVSAAPATGRITGFVRDADGHSIQGAYVTVSVIGTDPYGMESFGPEPDLTDATGAYSLTVPPGRHTVLASAHGFKGAVIPLKAYLAVGAVVHADAKLVKRPTIAAASALSSGPAQPVTRPTDWSSVRVAGDLVAWWDVVSSRRDTSMWVRRVGDPAASVIATFPSSSVGGGFDINSRYAYVGTSGGLVSVDLTDGHRSLLSSIPADGVACDEEWVCAGEYAGGAMTLVARRVDGTAVRRFSFGTSYPVMGPGSVRQGRVAVCLVDEGMGMAPSVIRVADLASGKLLPGGYSLGEEPSGGTPAFVGAKVAIASDAMITSSILAIDTATWKTSTLVRLPTDGAIIGLTSDGERLLWRELRNTSTTLWTLMRTRDPATGAIATIASSSRPGGNGFGWSTGYSNPWDVDGDRLAWADPPQEDDASNPYGAGMWGPTVVSRLASETTPVRLDEGTLAPADQAPPSLGDGVVFWLDNRDYRTSSLKFDLYGMATTDTTGTLVATDVVGWSPEAASGGHAVYSKESPGGSEPGALEVHLVDFPGGTDEVIGLGPNETPPLGGQWTQAIIAGDWVYYSAVSTATGSRIVAFRIEDGTSRVVADDPAVSLLTGSRDGKVLLAVWRYVPPGPPEESMMVYDPVAGSMRPIGGPALGVAAFDWPLGVGGDWLAYPGDAGPEYGFSLSNSRRFTIDPNAFPILGDQRQSGHLSLIGDAVFDMRTGVFYDLSGGQQPAAPDPWGLFWDVYPVGDLDGTHVAYCRQGAGGAEQLTVGDLAPLIWDPATRLAGIGRAGTSVALSQDISGSATVVITSGHGFADALAGTPLAHALHAPVLLVEQRSVPASVSAEIERLGATNAVVLGGSGAVGNEVVESLASDLHLAVERLGGSNRYETAALAAAKLQQVMGGGPVSTAFIVDGSSFADAVSAAPVAAHAGAPVLLSYRGAIPQATRDAMTALGTTNTVVVGPVAATLPYPHPVRLGGADRYATCKTVAEYGLAHGLTLGEAVIANGRDYPDALAAGPYAARHGAPLLIVDNDRETLPSPISKLLVDHKADISKITIAGGEGSVWLPLQQQAALAIRP